MNKYRYIPVENKEDSYMKMATEEAIMNAVRKRQVPPTLRFYSWNRPAVVLGFFQKIKEELDLDACAADNIELCRRITGGGAVYKSPEYEINYSFISREDEQFIPKDVEDSYRLLCGAVIAGLEQLGFHAKFKPINDIMIDGKKVSGNAQTRIDNVMLHHGTILLLPEAEKMFKYLKINDSKLREKKVQTAKELVTGLYVYKQITHEDVMQAIQTGFATTLKAVFYESTITREEQEEARVLQEKYRADEFVHWR